MPGLSLGIGGYGAPNSAPAYSGGAVPVAANISTGTTVSQNAFGIGTGQADDTKGTAGFGTVALGVGGALVLTWLWYTLPR